MLGASSDTLSRRAVLPPSEWTEHLMEYLGQARAGGLAGVDVWKHKAIVGVSGLDSRSVAFNRQSVGG